MQGWGVLPITGDVLEALVVEQSPPWAWHHQVTSWGPSRGLGVTPLDQGVSSPHDQVSFMSSSTSEPLLIPVWRGAAES